MSCRRSHTYPFRPMVEVVPEGEALRWSTSPSASKTPARSISVLTCHQAGAGRESSRGGTVG